jgi:hypothetical protein
MEFERFCQRNCLQKGVDSVERLQHVPATNKASLIGKIKRLRK